MSLFRLTALLFFALLAHVGHAASPTLSNSEFKAITDAQLHLDESRYAEARARLENLLARKALKPYPKALSQQLLANVALAQDKTKTALKHFQNAHKLQALPERQQRQLLKVIAQIHLQLEQWKPAIKRLQRYIKDTRKVDRKQLRAEDFLLLAQANAQIERWKSVIPPIKQAIAMRRKAPENWLQLQLAAHVYLEQHKSTVTLLSKRILPRFADKKDYWLRLAAAQQSLQRWQDTLSSLRAAYAKGFLDQAHELRWLIQLFLQQDAPKRAQEVIETALENKHLKPNRENLKLWADASMLAKDFTSAEKALKQWAAIKADVKVLTRLAEVQFGQQRWQAADNTLQKALKHPKAKRAKLTMMRGIAALRQANYMQATALFQRLVDDPKVGDQAQGWLDYLAVLQPPPKA